MKIKKYLKDKQIYIILYMLNVIFLMTVMFLSFKIYKVEIPKENMVYGLIFSLLILAIGLYIGYRKSRKFYDIVSNNEDLSYVFSIPENISVEYDLLRSILLRDYSTYIKLLEEYREEIKLNRDFNNRWIHEMKTPLSIISLILENEKERNNDIDSLKNYESIEEEVNKLSKGLEMSLYNLRVKDFSLDFTVESLNLIELLREVINEEKSNFIRNGIYPKIEGDENISIVTDKKWLKFVLGQILNNSIKYTREKAGEKSLMLTMEEGQGVVSLKIRDSGVGISKGDIRRVFNPFFTGTNGRKYKSSTGMGLYLSKEILDRLGHSIFITSIEGDYTEVKLVFREKSIYNLS